jgi:Flp pilus assembly protein TadD
MLYLQRLFSVILLAAPMVAAADDPHLQAMDGYVGSLACAKCHANEFSAWQGSHHDLAMQPATADTVLADFDDTRFEYTGVTSRFFRRGDAFVVETDGPDGELTEYEIAYTFGFDPLQQYLIEFPGGRLQTLSISWDSRPVERGGQRWFHMYPDESVDHTDVLHWTRLSQNWNLRCAVCHSTALRKNYDPDTKSYSTRYAEMDVACETCHGPGQAHTESHGADPLGIDLGAANEGDWVLADGGVLATRTQVLPERLELNVCAPCHSRRSQIAEQPPGPEFFDAHWPALLRSGLYHADGQILEEVYVWGSFLQSRMYQAGVTCSDCHEPHSLKTRADGNALCANCHAPDRYDTASHHHHGNDSAGAQCVECHMPESTYMVVDPRRDHSLRVPRPDLSVKLGMPNACNKCHTDQDARWAADALRRWGATATPHYAEAIAAGRSMDPRSLGPLAGLANDATLPAIVRATALELLRNMPTEETLMAAVNNLGDPDPLVRLAAVDIISLLPAERRGEFILPLLDDPVLAVRIETARVLAPVSADLLDPEQLNKRDERLKEYMDAQRLNADTPEALGNMANLSASRRQFADAERYYHAALDLEPMWVPARVNLADLYRVMEQDQNGENVLREGLDRVPGDPVLTEALAMNLVRQGENDEALDLLRGLAEAYPDQIRAVYLYAVALNSTGRATDALGVLEQALVRFPDNPDLLVAIITISRDVGLNDQALRYAQEYARLYPGDASARQLLQELGGQ